MPRRLIAAAALALAATVASTATVSTAAAQQQQVSPLAPRVNALTTQPLSDLLGFYNLEFERSIGPTTSLGVQGMVANDDFSDVYDNDADEHYSSFEGKVRYYPSGRVLTGFSVGTTLGVSRYSSRPTDYCFFTDCSSTSARRVSVTGAKIGFELDYNWLLGADEKFVVAAGLGAKRFLGDDKTVTDVNGNTYRFDVPSVYPTARLAIGYAF